jgi:transposase
MHGPDSFTEGLFTMRRLDDFVPSDHPLRRIRGTVKKTLMKMDALSHGCTEADIKGARPSIAPEKLLARDAAADLVQRAQSECRLMEQTQYSMLFRWFIGLAIDDAVWVQTVFSKNRQRLIEHTTRWSRSSTKSWRRPRPRIGAGRALQRRRMLMLGLGGHKSFVRKDGDNDAGIGGDFKGQGRSDNTHESKTDPD